MSDGARPTGPFGRSGEDRRTGSLPDSGAGLPVEQALLLDVACDAFEGKWRGKGRPDILAAVLELPDPLRPAALREFVQLDVFYRREAGESPRAEDYTAQFPDLDRDWLAQAVGHAEPPVTPAPSGAPDRVGEFRVLREVGRGGMGVVYEAVQETLGRHVALKVLPAHALDDPRRLERFRREARAAARLHHTNIVPVFGVGESGGRHYYAMQYIPGRGLDAVVEELRRLAARPAEPARGPAGELASALRTGSFAPATPPSDPDGPTCTHTPTAVDDFTRTHDPAAVGDATRSATDAGPPPPPPASAPVTTPPASGSLSESGRGYWAGVARVGAQVADALAYAHDQGVLHRDIKPSNLLLDAHGTVWVTDFGLAKLSDAEDLTYTGDVIGTLRYMAPERFDGRGDHRADVYALGLVLYEMLTLRPAFDGESKAELVEQAIAASPPPPRAVNPRITRDLETVVLKATARDPALRYQGAGELAADLRRYLEDRPILARRASSAEQAWRWCRRNPAVAGLLAAVVLVSTVGAVAAALIAGERSRTAADLRRTAGELDETVGKLQAEQDALVTERNRASAAAKEAGGERDRVSRLLYAIRLNTGSTALNEGRIARLLEILDETTPRPGEPDMRGWEWHYLRHLTRGPQRSFSPGQFVGDGLWDTWDFSADGRRMVVWRAEKFAEPNLENRVRSGWENVYFEVWDVATGRPVARLPRSGTFRGGGFSFLPSAPRGAAIQLASPLSPDGRLLAAVCTDESYQFPSSLRIWEVDSGKEVSVPEPFRGTGSVMPIALGHDRAEVRWLEQASTPQVLGFGLPVQPPIQGFREGKLETLWYWRPLPSPFYAARSWDRATGRTTTHSFRPGAEGTMLSPTAASADGRIVVFGDIPQRKGPALGNSRSDPNVNGPLECWDVSSDPPRLLWTSPTPGRAIVSPGGKMVAVTSPGGLAVYRAEGKDGRPLVEWDQSQAGVFPKEVRGHTPIEWDTWAVSDDGRVALYGDYKLRIVSGARVPGRPGSGSPFALVKMARERVLYHPDVSESEFSPPWRGAPGRSRVRFGADGRTLLTATSGAVRVGVWDIPPDPERDVFGRSAADTVSPDGRFVLERPTPLFTGKGGGADAADAGFVLKDAKTGAVVGRVPVDPANRANAKAQFVAGSRRLLVQHYGPRNAGDFIGRSVVWGLYDTEDKLRRVEGGEGPAVTNSGGYAGYFGVITSRGGRWLVGLSADGRELVVRDAMTGAPTLRAPQPDGVASQSFEFDPTDDRLAVVTAVSTGPAGKKQGPPFQDVTADGRPRPSAVDVAVYDPASGRQVWSRNGIVEAALRGNRALFAPGGRLLVVHPGEFGRNVWVGRAEDGSPERTLTAPAPDGPRTPPLGRPVGGVVTVTTSFDQTGRRLAVAEDRVVRVWDLDTGALVATVGGHDGVVYATALTPDGTRLFTIDSVQVVIADGGAGPPRERFSVWDLMTGRLLLVIPASSLTSVNAGPGLFFFGMEYRGGKIILGSGTEAVTLDGTPVKE